MRKPYHWMITALTLVLLLTSCAGKKTVPPPSVAKFPLPITDATGNAESRLLYTTPDSSAPPQPPTLADAQAAYRNIRTLNETAEDYDRMCRYFRDNGWYDRALDECAEIEQRFPGAQEIVMRNQMDRAHILAKLGRLPEAYALADAVDARYQGVYTPCRRMQIPLCMSTHFCALEAKENFLAFEHKYREAAAASDQQLAYYRTPPDAALQQYVATHKDVMEQNRFMECCAAGSYYYQAGDYATAVSRYTEALASMDTVNYDWGLGIEYHHHYATPVELAMCQMKLARYADALKTYRELEQGLRNAETRRLTFDMRGAGGTKSEVAEDPTAVAYFTRVDLQLRLAECLIRLDEKRQAQRALDTAKAQLADRDFAAEIRQPYCLSYHIAGRATDATWIDEIQTTTIPALQRQIDKL